MTPLGSELYINYDASFSNKFYFEYPFLIIVFVRVDLKILLLNEAQVMYNGLRPSLKLEIVRYISFLKTEESVERNVLRAINFYLGKSGLLAGISREGIMN